MGAEEGTAEAAAEGAKEGTELGRDEGAEEGDSVVGLQGQVHPQSLARTSATVNQSSR